MTAASSVITLDSLHEMNLTGPSEMLALLKKVGANAMASEQGADAKKKAEAVCQKILDMLDDVEKVGKVCLEGSIEKEKTTAALAVVSQLKGFVKSHLLEILCPPPFFGQVLSRLAEMFSGCRSKTAVPAISPVRAALPSPVRAALPSPPTPPAISASPLSSDVAAVEARLAVRDPLPAQLEETSQIASGRDAALAISVHAGEEADPASKEADPAA